MKIEALVLILLGAFSFTMAGIMLHELVHIEQASSSGYNVTEVCFLGDNFKNDNVGWVKFDSDVRYDRQGAEGSAIAVQFAFVILMMVLYMRFLKKKVFPDGS